MHITLEAGEGLHFLMASMPFLLQLVDGILQ